jgi:CDP-diglyceride synthetase
LALYLPIYAYFAGTSFFKAPLSDIALQAIVQGFLTGIVALLLYGCMVSILGATSGSIPCFNPGVSGGPNFATQTPLAENR